MWVYSNPCLNTPYDWIEHRGPVKRVYRIQRANGAKLQIAFLQIQIRFWDSWIISWSNGCNLEVILGGKKSTFVMLSFFAAVNTLRASLWKEWLSINEQAFPISSSFLLFVWHFHWANLAKILKSQSPSFLVHNHSSDYRDGQAIHSSHQSMHSALAYQWTRVWKC